MDGLKAALRGESDFKWAVVPHGTGRALKVMPAHAGGDAGGWPRIELAHTVLAGEGGQAYAAGSGTFMEGFPAMINNWSGHFEPPGSTLPIGEDMFNQAGIDVMSSPIDGS
jgi:hypothetical protein